MNMTPIIKGILERNFKNIGTLPTVIGSLIRVLNDPKSSARDLAKIIASDQVLTARLLRLVNSAYVGVGAEVIDIDQAVSLLGYNAIQSFTFCISIFDSIKASQGVEFNKEKFWIHSLSVGSTARKIAEKHKIKNSENYYVAGVVHDIGKVFMYQFLPDYFFRVLKRVQEKNVTFFIAEKAEVDTDHAEIGAWLMRKWKLPDLLVRCIDRHHRDMIKNDEIVSPEIIALADCITKEWQFGSSGDMTISDQYELLKRKYYIDKVWISDNMESVRDEVGVFAEIFTKSSKSIGMYS